MVVVGAHFLLRCLDLERFVLYVVKVQILWKESLCTLLNFEVARGISYSPVNMLISTMSHWPMSCCFSVVNNVSIAPFFPHLCWYKWWGRLFSFGAAFKENGVGGRGIRDRFYVLGMHEITFVLLWVYHNWASISGVWAVDPEALYNRVLPLCCITTAVCSELSEPINIEYLPELAMIWYSTDSKYWEK